MCHREFRDVDYRHQLAINSGGKKSGGYWRDFSTWNVKPEVCSSLYIIITHCYTITVIYWRFNYCTYILFIQLLVWILDKSPNFNWVLNEIRKFKKVNLALTFLQSKKRHYFGLERRQNKLVYYKDKEDFDKRRDPQGSISLLNTLCQTIEGNLCSFVL